MPDAVKASPAAAGVGIALAVVILLLYAVVVSALSNLAGSDAAGNALSQAYGAIALIALWVLLAALVIIACIKGAAPRWAAAIALVLVPVSGVVAMMALDLLSHPDMPPHLWPLVIPAAVPPLLLAFSFWTLLPSWHGKLPAPLAAGVALGGTVIVCLAIVPMLQARGRAVDQLMAERAKYDADLARLSPDAPLWEWTPFLKTRNESKAAEIRLQMRMLPRRQSEAELMLERGDFPLGVLGAIDLDPTPALCGKARALLDRRAAALTLPAGSTKPYVLIGEEVSDAVAATNWLVGYGCDCNGQSFAWETMAKAYTGTSYDIYRLAELRQSANLGRTAQRDPERFSMLTPQSHLKAWIKFAEQREYRGPALDGMRKLDHRTADLLEMLRDRSDPHAAWTAVRYIPEVAPDATADLCGAALAELRGQFAKIHRPKTDDPRPYSELLARLGNGEQLPALQWLASHGCDAEAGLTEAETMVRAYQDSPDRAAMLAALAALHRKP